MAKRGVEATSAGGLVLDVNRRGALIGRQDRRGRMVWSLPKGHIEVGESPEAAAVREIREETGISGSIVAPLGVINFWFMAENRRVHKTVHHFLLRAEGGELSSDDAEIDSVEWVALADIPTRLAYADERRLVDRVEGLLADS
jgi:ADP-ribose pyrophosphatase YjhB (NUDIX family)